MWPWSTPEPDPRLTLALKQLDLLQKMCQQILREQSSQGVRMHQELLELSAKFDVATSAIAARFDKLVGSLKNAMTDEEFAEVKAAFQVEIDKLTLLGKDPANPIP